MELTNSAKAFTPPGLQAHFEATAKKHELEKKAKVVGPAKITELGLQWFTDGKGHTQWIVPPLTVSVVADSLLSSGKSRLVPIYKARLADGEEVTLLTNVSKKEHGEAPALKEGDMVTIHGRVADDGRTVFTYKVGA